MDFPTDIPLVTHETCFNCLCAKVHCNTATGCQPNCS